MTQPNTVLPFALALSFAFLTPRSGDAQCSSWLSPTDSTGYLEFNATFGGAPCDDGTGCSTYEPTGLEVWADEAYYMDNILAGGTYVWSTCNGTGGLAWPLEFTILAPSGNIDAYGLDVGSSCAITWTATESGNYIIIVSEAGACLTSSNSQTNNGIPSITCVSGADCNSIGIEEVAEDPQILIFPNPSTGTYTVSVDVAPSSVQVFDMMGRVQGSINAQNENGVLTFDLSGKDNGTYVVNVVTDGVQISERITLIN